ncbi:hypothetical protein [Agromyces sp. NBRC 114283]|jgi:hypothetical protein|uniref:hypothetical protein n=1 Tax=Agromyces sp. NBRC 114283 TaxID=2994521 RepID=UPI0024A47413|nr:hypothetical protein [Agromyces sp. NBRC 114283]GLU90764.1 hypothetical protein Agsp01_30190 [Agromyces sp. NBRC 114283]
MAPRDLEPRHPAEPGEPGPRGPRDWDEVPAELAFADDGSAPDGPSRWERRRRVIRFTVIVALVAMLAPIVLSTVSVAQSSAARSCAVIVSAYDRDAAGSHVALELFGPGGAGWICYADASGEPRPVANLGLLPGAPPRVLGPDEVSS